MPDELIIERAGPVAVLIFNRPERMNAIGWSLLEKFRNAVREVDQDDSVRAVVLTGEGRAFSAGTDLQELASDNRSAGGAPDAFDPNSPGPWNMTSIGKPTVAAVNGAAVGLGVELATQCDVRIGSTVARCAWAFPLRGLVPDTGAATYILPHIVGLQTALRWSMSGRMVAAEELQQHGFFAEVVAPEQLRERAIEVAAEMCVGAPLAIRETKRLTYRSFGRGADDHIQDNREALNRMFQTEDHKEGVNSFLEKREPNFTGR